MKITVHTDIRASLDSVWRAWTSPQAIMQWNAAVESWCCPRAELELVEGGRFHYRMEAKDGSMGFDYEGTFVAIRPQQSLVLRLGDDRKVEVVFTLTEKGVRVAETFATEDENSAEQQRQGWQAILDHFREFVERTAA